MLYWLPAAGASSARLYWESFTDAKLPPISVPAGCSMFPKEIIRMPRRAVEAHFGDLRHWRELDRGGHFAALEQPGVLVEELRTFFALVR
jgi:pimeloyl-ACP methyl ester carboxylesterase